MTSALSPKLTPFTPKKTSGSEHNRTLLLTGLLFIIFLAVGWLWTWAMYESLTNAWSTLDARTTTLQEQTAKLATLE
jgi:hypothetical protein